MTKTERDLCLNEEMRPLCKMTNEQRGILSAAKPKDIQYLGSDAMWLQSVIGAYREGWVYRIKPDAEITPPPPEYTVYPVLPGAENWVYKQHAGAMGTTISYAVGMLNFAGIRYENGSEWLGVLDTVRYGKPVEIRFKKGAA